MVPEKKHIMIDGSHVVMTLREINSRRARVPAKDFDYDALISGLLGDAELGDQSAIYISRPPDSRKPYLATVDQELLRSRGLQVNRLNLKEREITCFCCENRWTIYQEKPVDAALIIGMFKAARVTGAGDSIVLVSGDGDFYDAVWEISENWGVPIQVYGFRAHSSEKYKRDDRFNFQELDQFLVRTTSRPARPPTRKR